MMKNGGQRKISLPPFFCVTKGEGGDIMKKKKQKTHSAN